MATIVNLFLDSTEFSGATAVDIDLTIKAPDGFYTYGTLNREQLGGLLQVGAECSTIQPCPEPVDCVVSAWSDWSACSLNGTQTRTRTVITPASGGGTACPVLEETQNCPVDCVVSEWSEWSVCSGGTQTRTRTIVTPALNGGATCPVLEETQPCVEICCGNIFFPASNYTDEDLSYAYSDCETGETLYITVYYGTGGETVYGRIPCNINSFGFTQARSTAIESCGDTVGGVTLYSPNTTLELGDRLYEDDACAFAYAHGVVFMKEVATGQVWQVDGNGLLIAAPTC